MFIGYRIDYKGCKNKTSKTGVLCNVKEGDTAKAIEHMQKEVKKYNGKIPSISWQCADDFVGAMVAASKLV